MRDLISPHIIMRWSNTRAPNMWPLQAIRAKSVLSKFCESVLTKSAKIRSLIADLTKNYEDESATKS